MTKGYCSKEKITYFEITDENERLYETIFNLEKDEIVPCSEVPLFYKVVFSF